jgi:hypothetical protein
MQVRYGRDHAQMMTELLDHAAVSAPTAELRQYAAETAALMRYRSVKLWGAAAPATAAPAVPQGAVTATTEGSEGDGGDMVHSRAKRPAGRPRRVSVPAAAAGAPGTQSARAS